MLRQSVWWLAIVVVMVERWWVRLPRYRLLDDVSFELAYCFEETGGNDVDDERAEGRKIE